MAEIANGKEKVLVFKVFSRGGGEMGLWADIPKCCDKFLHVTRLLGSTRNEIDSRTCFWPYLVPLRIGGIRRRDPTLPNEGGDGENRARQSSHDRPRPLLLPESQSSTVSLPTSGTFGSEEVESVCARTRRDYPELTVEICDRGGISCKAEVIRG